MGLRAGLKADRDDEAQAVKDYGVRQQQAHAAGRHPLAAKLKGVQRDERRHHGVVSRALKGAR